MTYFIHSCLHSQNNCQCVLPTPETPDLIYLGKVLKNFYEVPNKQLL